MLNVWCQDFRNSNYIIRNVWNGYGCAMIDLLNGATTSPRLELFPSQEIYSIINKETFFFLNI